MAEETKACLQCGEAFRPLQKRSRFCSSQCANKYGYGPFRKRKGPKIIDTEQTCARCGGIFKTKQIQKYCSQECSHVFSRLIEPRECQKCGKVFTPPAGNRGKKYCSWECFASRREGKERRCKACGKGFPWSKNRLYCSRECIPSQKKVSLCLRCGEEFHPGKHKTKYCGKACAVADAASEYQTKRCDVCGNEFSFPVQKSRPRRFCSHACSARWSQENLRVLGGRRKRKRKGGPSSKVRFEVLRQHGFKCFYCGRGAKHGVAMVLEHVNPLAKNGKDDPRNYVAACEECNEGKGTKLVKGAKRLDRIIEEQLFLI